MNELNPANPTILLDLVKIKMPFGKYKDTLICNLPEFYLLWFKQQGFPKGKLGILLETMLEIRINGLEDLLTPLKKASRL
ncbi:MAG: DUF3820 family protein [Flavobacteriales bacterium]|nr:DUF3820 family protein [Flavobacteriales bacterium]MCB9173947.1 DUF3820 family protein [Flavobacteriales bacterium]